MELNGPVLTSPVVARLPLQAPLAVHSVALVLDQVSMEDSPLFTDLGVADKDRDGGSVLVLTMIVTERLAEPLLPVQASV